MEIELYINAQPNKEIKEFLYYTYLKDVKNINTVKAYISSIFKVYSLLEYDKMDLKFLNNPHEIEKKLLEQEYKDATMKAIFTSLVKICKTSPDVNSESKQALHSLMMKYTTKNQNVDTIRKKNIRKTLNELKTLLTKADDQDVKHVLLKYIQS